MGRLSKKILSCQYRNSHFKRLSHLYNGDASTGKDGLYIEMGPISQMRCHYTTILFNFGLT